MIAAGRLRADLLLVARGLAASRTQARAAIAAGQVFADEVPVRRPGALLPADAALALRGAGQVWASRAGLKLAHALDHFCLDPHGRVALDLGASTGGFTDVLLARGAARVYAVDVGHGQMLACLATDSRVILREGINARALSAAEVPEPVGLITCDVSFIGLRLALPPALGLAAPGADLVTLIKPQFEVGPEHVGKGGVVRDPAQQRRVCAEIAEWLAAQPGWSLRGITESPILGGSGNREFLISAMKTCIDS